MESVTRVLVRLDREDAFADLKKTPRFRTIAIDHDEEWQPALKRKVRLERTRG
jgi:hypothetical protein